MTLKVVTNETTAANLLLTGGANLASIGGPDRTRLNKAKLFSTVTAAQPNELFFNENPGHPGRQPGGSQGARAGAEPRVSSARSRPAAAGSR